MWSVCVQNERCVGERGLERERERGGDRNKTNCLRIRKGNMFLAEILLERESLYNIQFLVTGNDFLAKVLRPLLATVLVTTAP